MGLRFNPPPNWPPPPPGFVPPPRWQPDPSWPPPPPGWQLWVPDDSQPRSPAGYAGSANSAQNFTTGPQDFTTGPQDFTAGSGDFFTGPDDFTGGPAGLSGHGDFATGPGAFPTGPGDFSTGPGNISTGPGDYVSGAPTALDPLAQPGAYPVGPSGPGGPAGRPGRTNGWAIAAFILGLLGGSLLGIIVAIVALRQIGDGSRQRGKGLAIAGLALSIIWSAALLLYLVLGNAGTPAGQSAGGGSHPSASASSPPAGPGGGSSSQANVFSLRTGQCFQNPSGSQAVLGITYVAVVPCTTLHNAQVFVEFPATGSAYPGSASLKHQADLGCHARIAGNVDTSKITDSMTLQFLYPLPTSWAQSHRTITCLVVDSKTDLKSSLLRIHPAH